MLKTPQTRSKAHIYHSQHQEVFKAFRLPANSVSHGSYKANSSQVNRRQGPKEAACHQGSSQIRPSHRRCQEASQVLLLFLRQQELGEGDNDFARSSVQNRKAVQKMSHSEDTVCIWMWIPVSSRPFHTHREPSIHFHSIRSLYFVKTSHFAHPVSLNLFSEFEPLLQSFCYWIVCCSAMSHFAIQAHISKLKNLLIKHQYKQQDSSAWSGNKLLSRERVDNPNR